MEIEMEMKASLLTRNVLALDAISNGVETGCKQIPHWRYPRLLISSLGVAIFVATAWNAACASVAGDEKPVAALDSQYRTAVKQNGGGQPPQASDVADSPDKAMMAPATALATYMAQVEGAVAPSVFVDDGLVIVENFAPYIFVGKDAAGRWDAGIRQHLARLRTCSLTSASPTISTAPEIESTSYSPPLGGAYIRQALNRAGRTRRGGSRNTGRGLSCSTVRLGNGESSPTRGA